MLKMLKMLKMNELQVGMRVEVTNRYSSDVQNGLVVELEEITKSTFIDGKPIASRKVKTAKIAYNQGGELTISEDNINMYRIIAT